MSGDLWTLSRRAKAPHVLVIDDYIPGTRAEARMPRAAELLRALAAAGAQVTVLPARDPALEETGGYAALRLRHRDDLGRVLATRHGSFVAVFVSRPANMAMMADVLAHDRSVIGDALVVYDAEVPPAARAEADMEFAGARRADIVLALEAATAAVFRGAGHPDARVLGYAAAPQRAPPFGRRSGLLAVGATYGDPASIAGGVGWLAENVLPLLRARLGRSATLTVAGEDISALKLRSFDRAIVPLSLGSDPGPAFDRARVFVVPPQAAGGLPFNVYDAAAHGVAAVLPPVQARRIGWDHGRDVLVAETAEEFAAACVALHGDQLLWEGLGAAARARVRLECDRDRFDATIREVIAQAVSTRR